MNSGEILELQEFYFLGMRRSRSGKIQETLVGGQVYVKGSLSFTHIRLPAAMECKLERTIITKDSVPLWYMDLHGWCVKNDQNVLALRAFALEEAFERWKRHGAWLNGLGPMEFEMDGMRYRNRLDPHKSKSSKGFEWFGGDESIFCSATEINLPFHSEYRGGLLGHFSPPLVLAE